MTYGKMAVDWEDRVNFDKLRKDRIEKANKTMHKYGIGSAIIYNHDMKRYVSSYWSHPYSKHIPNHFHLLLRDTGFPYVAHGHIDPAPEISPSWLRDRLAGDDILSQPLPLNSGMFSTEQLAAQWKKTAQQIKALQKKHGVADLPCSIDYTSPASIKGLTDGGIQVVDGNLWAQETRIIKTDDEIELMKMAATCNEAGYADLVRELRPGMRECDAQAIMIKAAHEAGGEYEEGWVTGSGERHAPRRYNWSDKTIRPGELFVIEECHVNYCGYKVCCDRTFMVGAPPNETQKEMYQLTVDVQKKMMKTLRPGITNHEAVRARPSAPEVLKSLKDVKDVRATMTNHFGGQGISWNEAPTCSLNVPPVKLEKNMTIAHALNYSIYGYQGVGIENTYRITDTGCENLTLWPWEEMMVVGYL